MFYAKTLAMTALGGGVLLCGAAPLWSGDPPVPQAPAPVGVEPFPLAADFGAPVHGFQTPNGTATPVAATPVAATPVAWSVPVAAGADPFASPKFQGQIMAAAYGLAEADQVAQLKKQVAELTARLEKMPQTRSTDTETVVVGGVAAGQPVAGAEEYVSRRYKLPFAYMAMLGEMDLSDLSELAPMVRMVLPTDMIVDLGEIQSGSVVVMAPAEVHDAIGTTLRLFNGEIGRPGKVRFILPVGVGG